MEKYKKYVEYHKLKEDYDIQTAMGYLTNEIGEVPTHICRMAKMWLDCDYIKDEESSSTISNILLYNIDNEFEKWVNITRKYRVNILKTYVPYYDSIGGVDKEFDSYYEAIEFANKLWVNEDFKIIISEYIISENGEVLDCNEEMEWENEDY